MYELYLQCKSNRHLFSMYGKLNTGNVQYYKFMILWKQNHHTVLNLPKPSFLKLFFINWKANVHIKILQI